MKLYDAWDRPDADELIDMRMPHTADYVTCLECHDIFFASWPVGATDQEIECPNCGAQDSELGTNIYEHTH